MAMIAPMTPRKDDQEVALGQRIASNIQALLRARGLTQGQLAAYAGLPQSSISALIIGRRNPSLLSIWKVSQALGVPLEELSGFKPLQIPDYVAPETQSNQQLAHEVQDLRRELLELAQRQDLILRHIEAGQSGSRKKSTPA